jgi:regulator of cell morphogenesis and NO signaling
MRCDLDSSVPEWIVEHPEAERVFREWGLDTSCAGKSLRYVCIHAGVSPAEIFQRLRSAINHSMLDDQGAG